MAPQLLSRRALNSYMTTIGKILVAVGALAVLGFGVYWYEDEIKGYPAPWEQGTGPVACTQEAMQCPDGSYVGRTGPHCEFICPTASSTTGSTSTGTGQSGGGSFAEYHSGIKGTVSAGPTCPVERTPPDPACADKPVATNVWISRKGTPSQVFATTASDKAGNFQISLPPGEYVIQAGSSGTPFPRCANAAATVGPTGYTSVAVSCDTGIR